MEYNRGVYQIFLDFRWLYKRIHFGDNGGNGVTQKSSSRNGNNNQCRKQEILSNTIYNQNQPHSNKSSYGQLLGLIEMRQQDSGKQEITDTLWGWKQYFTLYQII